MSAGAIVMMLLAMLIIWGGLVVAIVNLRRSTAPPSEADYRRDL